MPVSDTNKLHIGGELNYFPSSLNMKDVISIPRCLSEESFKRDVGTSNTCPESANCNSC